MDQWGVFGVIAALVTFGVCIGAPLLKLNSTITELKIVLQVLQKQFDKFCDSNDKEHLAIWDKVEKNEDMVFEHETRITVLEKHDK